MQVGSFCGILFQVSTRQVLTFKNLSRKAKARYHTHDILGATSKLEFVGTEPINITLEIQLLKQLGAPVQQVLETLREVTAAGIADYLIIGNENIGLFVIETVEESDYVFDGKGEVFMATVKLTLKQYSPIGDF